MTRLEAIQEILEGSGMMHASALASSGTWPSKTYQETDAGDAEQILDRELRKILSEGYWLNTLIDFRIYRPTYYYSYSSTDPVFTFNYVDTTNDRVYVGNVSAAPDASPGTLTGSTSGTTKAASSSTAVSSSKIAADPLWLSISGASCNGGRFSRETEYREVSMTYDATLATNFLVDMNPDSEANPTTTTFTTTSIVVNAVKNLESTTVPVSLQQWAVAQASVAFQRYKKRGEGDDQMLLQRLVKARGNFVQENVDNMRTNVLHTGWMNDFKGGRRGAGYGRW